MTSKQRAYLKGLAMTMESDLPDRQIQPDTRTDRCCGRGAGGPRVN